MIREKIIRGAAGEMALTVEDEIRIVLNEVMPAWSHDDVRRRCQIVRIAGSPVETLCVDGYAVLEMYPVESELERQEDRYVLRYTWKFRRLPRPALSELGR